MIEVQCQLMICRGHIRASKGTFQIFFLLMDLWQINILVKFCTLVFISSQILKGCKWVWRSTVLSGLNLNMVHWDPVQKWENFLLEGHRHKKRCTFLGPKHKSAIWDRTPPSYTSNLIYMCTGGFRGHKSSNRIELS